MKKIIAFFLALAAAASLAACNAPAGADPTEGSVTESASATEGTADTNKPGEDWTVSSRITCSVHHFDYHMLPYELIMHVGEDDVNAWMQECKVTSENADPDCPYSTYNIKSFIDNFNIPRETFAVKADLAHFAAYDCELLYTASAEEIESYFSNLEKLRDENIKAQSYSFLFNRFLNDYTGTVFDLAVPDSTGKRETSPSVPQVIVAVGMSKDKLEAILKEIDAKTLEICGKALSYDYDLDMLYNADGSLKELPALEGLEDYEKVLKYNSLFCQRGE